MILDQGNNLLVAGDGATKVKMTSDAREAQRVFKNKMGSKLGPYLETCDDECYGFPKGTRLVRIFASATHLLLIAKIGREYKIVSAEHGSPD